MFVQKSRKIASCSSTLFLLTDYRFLYFFSSIQQFKLPDLGEKIKEATLKKWYVKPGDVVEEYQTVADVSTDKMFTQIPATDNIKITKLLINEDENCQVGQPLFEFEIASDASPTQAAVSTHKAEAREELKKPILAPAVRGLIKEKNIDINLLKGTGKDGRIMKEDVLNYLENSKKKDKIEQTVVINTQNQSKPVISARPTAVSQVISEKNVIQMNGFEKGMQKSMTEALSIPQFYFKDEYDFTDLTVLREKINKHSKQKISIMAYVIKAFSVALSEYPKINSHYFPERPFEYVTYHDHNISIAIDSKNGLVVPHVKKCQNKTVIEISDDILRLRELADGGRLTANEILDGTLTISNIGNIGGTYVGPIIFRPQTLIAGMGQVRTVPKYIGEDYTKVEPRKIINYSYAADHRVLDGSIVAKFSAKIKQLLENPEYMLIHLK